MLPVQGLFLFPAVWGSGVRFPLAPLEKTRSELGWGGFSRLLLGSGWSRFDDIRGLIDELRLILGVPTLRYWDTVPYGQPGTVTFSAVFTSEVQVQIAELGQRHEIDLVLVRDDGKVLAVEVKLAATVEDRDIAHLRWLADHLRVDLLDAVIINTGPNAYRRHDRIGVVPLALLGPVTPSTARRAPSQPLAVQPVSHRFTPVSPCFGPQKAPACRQLGSPTILDLGFL